MAVEHNSSSAAEGTIRKANSPNVSTSIQHPSQPKLRRGLSSTHDGRTSLGCSDAGLFFVFVFFIAALIRVGVRFHILDQATVDRPPLFLQMPISMSLITALYWTVRIRHGSRIWTLLGWNRPDRFYPVAALVGGIGLATAGDFIARATTPTNHLIRIWDLLLLDVLFGPLVEESFFRGCLLPVVTRTTGPFVATLATAIVFATLHPLKAFVQWACFASTGVAYGWIPVKSGSTVPSILMHATFNATLYLYQIV